MDVNRVVALVDLAGGYTEGVLVAAAVAALVVLSLVRAVVRRRGPRPAEGELWFAQVPFDDGTGSKDRPVLVVSVNGHTCTVARFTSQDRSARRDHRRVPKGTRVLQRSSWVNLHPITLPRAAFRRRVARPDHDLVRWYAYESGWSAAA